MQYTITTNLGNGVKEWTCFEQKFIEIIKSGESRILINSIRILLNSDSYHFDF